MFLQSQYLPCKKSVNKKNHVMVLDEEKYKNYHCKHFDNSYPEKESIKTLSLTQLKERIEYAISTAEINGCDPSNIPVFIRDNRSQSDYCVNETQQCMGATLEFKMALNIGGGYSDEIYYVAPDKRPEKGEYWKSRGVGSDLSGFVCSKAAGERILKMVRKILGKKKPNSWLDYRKYEPTWIQFKFDGEEFNLEKLHAMATENGNIITNEILIECKL